MVKATALAPIMPDVAQPLATLMRRLMAEGDLTFRDLAEQSKVLDPNGRGLTHSYLSAVARGAEHPSLQAMQMIAGVLDAQPEDFIEYRLALARQSLDEKAAGLDEASAQLSRIEAALREAPELRVQLRATQRELARLQRQLERPPEAPPTAE